MTKKTAELAEHWLGVVTRAKRERDEGWGADAHKAEEIYEAKGNDNRRDFNILFSNVETIVPAIFNSTPVPDIRERHRQGDKLARQAADVLERVVSVQIDDGAMDAEVEQVARDGDVTGRGVLRVRFAAEEAENGVTGERVTYEAVAWREYVEGKAARWDQVPWIAFEHALDKGERDRVKDEDPQPVPVGEEEGRDTFTVWEIWDKRKQEVVFLQVDPLRILSRKPDPLGLKGFFPICKPYQPETLTGKREPVVPFKHYEKLAGELNETTKRINAITRGLKVRGIVVSGSGDIERLAEAQDNELITAQDTEGLVQWGLDKAVMWWPIETAVAVLRELYAAREATKQTIYEVTGISDIVRGASRSSETATAQQIKNEWGSLRIQRRKVMIERLVRDAFVMTVELIASRFTPETIMAQAGMQLPEEAFQLIYDPLMHYRVDVESDSTVRGDLTRQKGEMSEFLQGTAQYFSTMQGVVAAEPRTAGPAVALYASFARQFNLGRQAENALDELVEMAQQSAQQPQPENPEAGAQQAEAQAKAQEVQIKAQEIQAKSQEAQAKMQIEAARLQMDQQKAEREADRADFEMRLREAELGLKAQDRELKGLEIQIKQAQLGISQQEADRKDAEAGFNAAKAVEELEIEREQQRAAKIGDDV